MRILIGVHQNTPDLVTSVKSDLAVQLPIFTFLQLSLSPVMWKHQILRVSDCWNSEEMDKDMFGELYSISVAFE